MNINENGFNEERLADIRMRVYDGSLEGDTSPLPVPFITEATRYQLLEFVGLYPDPITRRILSSATGEPLLPPAYLAAKMAEEEIRYILENTNGEFIDSLDRHIKSRFDQDPNQCNYALLGALLVFKAFRLQNPEGFVERIGNIEGKIVMKAFQKTLGILPRDDAMILTREIGRHKAEKSDLPMSIPDWQLQLKACVERFSLETADYRNTMGGAEAMYRLFTLSSGILFPSLQTPTGS